ncbi:MAG: CBS domain-containing protein, partial [candidate division Zixibacteria bacterium]
GTTHATITSILIVFEMTKDYRIMLALMIACVFSTLVARRFLHASIYSMKLIRRGIRLRGGRDVNLLEVIKVGDIMQRDFKTIPMHTSLHALLRHLEGSTETTLPVVTPEGRLYGMISFQDLRTVLTRHEVNALVIASDIATREIVSITEDENLNQALEKFGIRDFDLLPVVEKDDPGKIKGVIHKSYVISYYNKRLMERMVAEKG